MSSLTKTPAGVKDDGTTKYNYDYTGEEGGGLLLTGPAAGTIRLADGTSYNVTPEVIAHGAGHAGPICHHIDLMHVESGALDVFDDAGELVEKFAHVCSDACGAEAAPAA